MPNVIVNSCYIKDSQHFINYLEYAGQKLEAQTLVLNDGTKIELDPDELLDITETPDFRYVQLEMKDGTIRRLGFEKYQKYVEEKTETIAEVYADKDFPEEDLQHTRSAEKYLDYIAFRPSVEKNPNLSHGLFGINGAADMQHAKQSVLENENSYKWSHIISLTREGAEATGFDNRSAWENLIRSRAYDIGKLYNIPPEHLELYAAYHDKAHHPHCHLFFWSNANTTAEGCAGFNDDDLTKKSEKLRSIFNNEIFKDEVSYLKEHKRQYKKELSEELKKLVKEIGKAEYMPDKKIVQAFIELSDSLSDYTGRAYYAYIPPEQKKKVNEFLRIAVSSDNNLNQIYNKLIENQRSFISMYNDDEEKIHNRLNDFEKRFFAPKNKNDMRQLHNIIIEQAMLFNQQINSQSKSPGVVRKEKPIPFSNETTSEESFFDENEPLLGEDTLNVLDEEDMYSSPYDDFSDYTANEPLKPKGNIQESNNFWTDEYKHARFLLYGNKETSPDLPKAYKAMLAEANKGNIFAMHDMAKMLLNGLGCEKNIETAQNIFSNVLNAFYDIDSKENNTYIKYRIGKMHEFGLGTEQNPAKAAEWYKQAAFAEKPNSFAAYSLGNLYYNGSGVKQDYKKAFNCFTISATAEKNPSAYAMYKLGDMYSKGIGISANPQKSQEWYFSAYSGFLSIEENNNNDYIQYKLGYMNYKGLGTEKNFTLSEEYYLRAAKLENINAYYGLSQLYSNKNFDGYDIKKAVDYYTLTIEKAVSKDSLKESYAQFGQYELGKIYLENNEIKDINKAIAYFKSSADQNNQFAQYNLGKIYLNCKKYQDIEKAVTYLKKAAEQDNPYAQYTLGKFYFENEKHQDLNKAISYLKKSSLQKNCFASYLLGNIYLHGIGTEADSETAQNYYSKAYEGLLNFIENNNENDAVLYKLGNMCLQGLGTKIDINQAILFFSNSAKLKNAYAAYKLGNIFSNNEHIEPNKEIADKWYKQAYKGFIKIEQNPDVETNDTILYNLGKMNLNGLGTEANLNNAIKFFTAAAELNNESAQYVLGIIYFENDEIQDINKAIEYFSASAEQNNEFAQYILGKIFLEGNYVSKDINKAIEYFKASAEQGNQYAKRKLYYISNPIEYKFFYATSLLLSRIAYALSNLVMQYSYNKQQEEEEKRQKNKKNQPKFASKNHQISKAHLEPQSPIQY